jgi:hypothetical protein
VSFVVFTSFAPLSRPGKKKTHYLLPRVMSSLSTNEKKRRRRRRRRRRQRDASFPTGS